LLRGAMKAIKIYAVYTLKHINPFLNISQIDHHQSSSEIILRCCLRRHIIIYVTTSFQLIFHFSVQHTFPF